MKYHKRNVITMHVRYAIYCMLDGEDHNPTQYGRIWSPMLRGARYAR